MNTTQTRRDEIAELYFDQLGVTPYPVQQEALLSWFTSEQGVMVCAPTGTGKTLIAEAAIFEALHLRKTAYYTTPLIALTDQKFRELQTTVADWGFHPDDVGLVTGSRRVNPQAPIQVVVAEILLNRLLHREAFDFADVWAVVMDEFHSFNDRERGIVWEFGLGLLPKQVKTLLLSATVGNAFEFSRWLDVRHNRQLKLVESQDRKVPLTYQWVGDQLLDEQIELMFAGDEASRLTPALVFCFNRSQCWTVAELLKGKKVVSQQQQRQLSDILETYDWSQGAGPKLKQLLIRGVGVHHAGILPKYRRIVEDLFQQKLLSICVCTETLAAGINLPARSVVLPTLMHGPPQKMKLIEASSAQQMFGRAGRPQYDSRGFVFALAHEDDVKILRWQQKIDQIPEDTRDSGLIKARKQLKKKMPKRREGVSYWSDGQFQQLVSGRPANLESRGPLTWRLLAWLLDASADLSLVRQLVSRRLIRDKQAEQADKQLDRMLVVLHRAGYVTLSPPPPGISRSMDGPGSDLQADETLAAIRDSDATDDPMENQPTAVSPMLDLGQRSTLRNKLPQSKNNPSEVQSNALNNAKPKTVTKSQGTDGATNSALSEYQPLSVTPTEKLPELLKLKGVHPLFAMFLMDQLGIADRSEKIQAFESLLELSPSLGYVVDVPRHDELPPGPLATTRLHPQLLQLGLATAEELFGIVEDDEETPRDRERPRFVRPLPLAHQLQRLFQHEFPGVDDLKVRPCWVAGEVLNFGGDFNKYITSYQLQKQEGIIFRHLLRLVLLIDELALLCPPEIEHDDWKEELGNIAFEIETCCRTVDSHSTNQWLDEARESNVLNT